MDCSSLLFLVFHSWRTRVPLFILVFSPLILGSSLCFSGCVQGGVSSEYDCSDGTDNDGDGLTDCEDPDCVNDPACKEGEEEICDNNVDDDGDGLTDCDDPHCVDDPVCTGEEICENGIDDDGDGFSDCEDPHCADDPACIDEETNCNNGIDDDGDGLTDCEDPDCAQDPACQAGDLSCKGVRYCYSCCPNSDQTCHDTCYAEGTLQAKEALDALQACIDGNCSTQCAGGTPQDCESCVNSSCAFHLGQCDWEPSGTGICMDLYNCVAVCPSPTKDHSGNAAVCPTNEGLICYQDCYSAADEDAVNKMLAWLYCMENKCYDECYGPDSSGQDCQDCYLVECSAETSACQND